MKTKKRYILKDKYKKLLNKIINYTVLAIITAFFTVLNFMFYIYNIDLMILIELIGLLFIALLLILQDNLK